MYGTVHLSQLHSAVWPSPLIRFSFDLFKVRFQHDVYPQAQGTSRPAADQPVSRQVFVVQDLEIRDRLAASQMNKFLYLYSSKEMPRKSHSNMVRMRNHTHHTRKVQLSSARNVLIILRIFLYFFFFVFFRWQWRLCTCVQSRAMLHKSAACVFHLRLFASILTR